MNWINPRDKLPQENELVWCLFVRNREGERCGLPSAEIELCEVKYDPYNVPFVRKIERKGYGNCIRHFYEWYHFYQNDDENYIYQANEDDEVITAWMPYDGLPSWNHIDIEESRCIITKTEGYKIGLEKDKVKFAMEKAQGSLYFLHVDDVKPAQNGIYVVANKAGIWLSRYDKELCNPWIAPNGEPVLAWYPIPDSY